MKQKTVVPKRPIALDLKTQWPFHVMLFPCVLALFVFHYIPIYGIIIAFQRYNAAMGFSSPWVGMANFHQIFSQPNFIRTIWNTLYIAVFKIIGGIVVPVTFALLLNELRNHWVKKIFQTIVYMPNFLSWVILAGILWEILSLDGVVNMFIKSAGFSPVMFLSESKIFPWTIIITDIWKGFGFGTVIYLASLANIDPGLYESAMIDGAGRWKQTVFITIPMMAPTIVLLSVLSLSGILSAGFDQIYNLYSPIVYSTGDVIDTFVYRMGIQQAQYSVGAAVGLFRSVVSAILIITSHVMANKLAGYRVF